MKKLRLVWAGVAFILRFTFILHAQEAATAVQSEDVSSMSDLAVELQALEQTTPIPASQLPESGTFWSAQHATDWPPLPGGFLNVPGWSLGDNVFVLDDLNVNYAALAQTAVRSRMASGIHAMDESGGFSPDFSFPSNSLYLQINAVSNGLAYVNLMNATDSVYEIYSKTDLTLTNWTIEQELWPTNTTSMPFTVSEQGRTNLFVWARDWTGITSGGNTVPEWWLYEFYDTVDLSDTNLDSVGNTLSYDYRNGYDPNIIHFNLDLPIEPVTSSPINGMIDIIAGTPSSMAVLVNDTNQADAVWQPYTSNVVANLSFGNGVYNVMVGLRGSPYAQTTWQSGQVTLFSVPLTLTITNPTTSTVSVPMIQVQGFANETLSNLTYDVTNASGNFTNQTGYLTGQFYDTNLLTYTTNYFQCYDVPLTNGLNQITLHAIDVAGGTATTTINVTLDYSGDHTAPVLSILWPTNGTSIAGSNLTVQAQTDDATATATGAINSNIVAGLVERSGAVWFNNLPLSSGTNTVTITATDAAGNMSETNFNVVQSSVSLMINPLTSSQMNQSSVTVTGTIGDSSDHVIVNGVLASVSGNNWTATNVPVSPTGTAALDAQVTDSGNNPLATQSDFQPQPSQVLTTSYQEKSMANESGIICKEFFTTSLTRTVEWTLGIGGQITQHSVDEFGNQCDASVDLATNWNSVAANGTSCEGNYSETLNPAWQYSSVDEPETDIYDSDCGGFDTYNYKLTRTVGTKIEVAGGGQRQNGTQQLVLLTAAAAEYSSLDVDEVADGAAWLPATNLNVGGNIALPASAMRILDQTLMPTATNANVGETVIALPAGGTQDITPTVSSSLLNQNHYSFNVTAQDVQLHILANGMDLSMTNAEFCVGQQVTFSNYFDPPITNIVASKVIKWVFTGNYVNNFTPGSSSSSTNYFADSTLLNGETNSEWWFSGGNPPATYEATLGENLTLSNGQQIVVTAKGQFNMVRPQAKISPWTTSVNIIDGRLAFESLEEDNGITFSNTIIIPSGFSGSVQWIQIVSNTVAEYQDTNKVWHIATENGSSPYGDYPIPYSAFDDTYTNYPVDSPGLLLLPQYVQCTNSGSFEIWMMFQPTNTGSIAVPLRSVNWFWGGAATNNAGTWILESGATNSLNPNDFDTQIFPLWNSDARNDQFIPPLF